MSKHHQNHNHHDHSHSHSHDHGTELPFEKKLEALFGHWIDHNDSHKESYLSWSLKASSHEQLAPVARILEDVAGLSDQVTKKLEQALSIVKSMNSPES